MLKEVGTLETLLVHSVLAALATCILSLAELKVLDAAVVIFVPVFIIPGLAQRDELILCQFHQVLLLREVLNSLWNIDGRLGEAFDIVQRNVCGL